MAGEVVVRWRLVCDGDGEVEESGDVVLVIVGCVYVE